MFSSSSIYLQAKVKTLPEIKLTTTLKLTLILSRIMQKSKGIEERLNSSTSKSTQFVLILIKIHNPPRTIKPLNNNTGNCRPFFIYFRETAPLPELRTTTNNKTSNKITKPVNSHK